MIIRRQVTDQTLVINTEQDFQTDLGWESDLMQFEEEVLKDIVNPIENYETVRYIHSPYTSSGVTQTDIWFYFYFIGSGGTYVQDYQAVGISNQDNEQLLPQSTKSFFRLELFKTPGTVVNNVLTCEPPTRQNRKLVFAKNLSLPIGEKVFDPILRGNLHIPVFTGSNYRNKENMYLFWFADESVLTETNLSGSTTGNTFFMSAKFYDAENGDILDFANECRASGYTINEARDMYYQVDIDKRDYSYKIYKYSGNTKGEPVGLISNPIKFFEKGGAACPTPPGPTPTPTPTITRTPAASSIPGASPTQTPTMTPTPTLYKYWLKLERCDAPPCNVNSGACLTGWTLNSYPADGGAMEGKMFHSGGDYWYRVVGTSLTNPNTPGGPNPIDGNISTEFNSCDGTPGAWTAPVINYTMITLVRGGMNTWNNLQYAKEQLCGKYPYNATDYVHGETTGGTIFQKYINYTATGMTPSTQYTVYNTENRTPGDEFDGGNYKYGIQIPSSGSTITYIAEVSPGGLLQNWSQC